MNTDIHTLNKWRRCVIVLFVSQLFGSLFCGCGKPSVTMGEIQVNRSPLGARKEAGLQEMVQDVLNHRELNQTTHGAWQVMHGVLAYGSGFPLKVSDGEQSAVEFLLSGGELQGWRVVVGDQLPNGKVGVRAIVEPGAYIGQGHADQWLAILAQADVQLTDTIMVEDKPFQVSDFLSQVQWDVPDNYEREWSWTLIALTQYLPTNSTWTASDRTQWSIERLLENEISQELESSTCGGTHRLIGISMALNRRYAEGAAITGAWSRAENLVRDAIATAKSMQNPDGSFSTNYFARGGVSVDNAKVLSTTGHILEFLALSLPDEELQQPWVQMAVGRLCQLLEDSRELPLECGALYHAVHGLVIYQQRVAPESSS